MEYAKRSGVPNPTRIRAISTVTPSYPQTTVELPNFATDSAAGAGSLPAHGFKESIAVRAFEEAGLGPDDLDCAEVYDLSTAMELDWYEQIGLCAEGEAEKLVRDGDTTIGGRIPVNASGGLASFGEAVPAQAIAQVCELAWQVQGRATGHQVDNAQVGFSINQGLFGHGSAVIVSR
jgi:acetyl-CoA acetyltransferase